MESKSIEAIGCLYDSKYKSQIILHLQQIDKLLSIPVLFHPFQTSCASFLLFVGLPQHGHIIGSIDLFSFDLRPLFLSNFFSVLSRFLDSSHAMPLCLRSGFGYCFIVYLCVYIPYIKLEIQPTKP